MKIDCQTNREKREKVFYIEGELDVHHVKSLKSEIMDSMESVDWVYELNMEKVSYLDSSGLGMLVYLKKEIIRQESKLRIVKIQDPVLNVFKLTKLDDFFELE